MARLLLSVARRHAPSSCCNTALVGSGLRKLPSTRPLGRDQIKGIRAEIVPRVSHQTVSLLLSMGGFAMSSMRPLGKLGRRDWEALFSLFFLGKCSQRSVEQKLRLSCLKSPGTRNRPAGSGANPSVPDHASLGPATSDAANERPHEGEHPHPPRLQPKCAERRNTCGELRASAAAASTNSTAS